MQPVTDLGTVDLRLYRLAWLPALLALIVVMFSLQGAPQAIEPVTAPGTFEPDRALREARAIVASAPQREPGSEGDELVAELVSQRFDEVVAGATSEQRFETDFEGEDVSLRNVLLNLPGDGDSAIVVLAPRDSPEGVGAASSAAATGILIELAQALSVAGHAKTFVLASTSGGAAGVEELLESLPERDSVEAVIAIWQPGADERREPFVVTTSSGEASAPIQLERTAELIVEAQAQERSPEPSALTQLARLAIPSGLGPQAPLLRDGLAAISISSAGERPLAAKDDELENLSAESLDAFGRAVQQTIGAVDMAPAPLERGPRTYLELGDNLVSGWTLALLSLALLIPAAVAAVDACARAARRGHAPGSGIVWAAARSLPFIGALGLVYLLALIGVIPRPPFPFDPNLHPAGSDSAVTLGLTTLAAIGSALLLRSRFGAARAPAALLPALGAVAVIAVAIAWLANPYLALVLVPAAHVWVIAAGKPGGLRRTAVVVVALLALIPPLLVLAAVARDLDLGSGAAWTFTIMLADGQIGIAVAVAVCLLGGAMAGLLGWALRGARIQPDA